MSKKRQQFTSEVDPELLAALHTLARQDGRRFEDVLEVALRSYIAARGHGTPRPEVMAHFRDSLEKNRELMKLLAE